VQPETESRSVHISYFLQNCKKGKSQKKGFALLKNDITTFELALKYGAESTNFDFYYSYTN